MNTSTNINYNPVGFFDSGVGGLTVYAKFRKVLPNENCLYFGDTINMPYGNKTHSELISYAQNIMNFFQSQNVKAVIIACNTSSSVAYDIIKSEYNFPIYPIIQCSCKMIAQQPIKKLGILATKATIDSDRYRKEIQNHNPNIEVYSHACINWANIVEEGSKNQKESLNIIKSDLNEVLKYNPEKIILGCTHYPYLTDVLTQITGKNIFIDPAEFFVDYIKNDFKKRDITNSQKNIGHEKIFVSSAPENFINAAKMFYELDKTPKEVNLKINTI